MRVARIFNTFGPRMNPSDGRVVSNFIIQALQGKPITIYGDGSQTRSFQYGAFFPLSRRPRRSAFACSFTPESYANAPPLLSCSLLPSVQDLVIGLIKLMNSEYSQPVNIGNPHEFTILQVGRGARHLRDLPVASGMVQPLHLLPPPTLSHALLFPTYSPHAVRGKDSRHRQSWKRE